MFNKSENSSEMNLFYLLAPEIFFPFPKPIFT